MSATIRFAAVPLAAGGALLLAACSGPPDFTGMWVPDDGSGTKIIDSSGACQGMYYAGDRVLDIGGPMSCAFSEKQDSQGYYTLVVSQPPNQSSYAVQMDGDDTMTLHSSAGNPIVTLQRR